MNPGCNAIQMQPLDIRFSMAAGLSARFPVVSPYGFFPERRSRRLIDGVLYDNSGTRDPFSLCPWGGRSPARPAPSSMTSSSRCQNGTPSSRMCPAMRGAAQRCRQPGARANPDGYAVAAVPLPLSPILGADPAAAERPPAPIPEPLPPARLSGHAPRWLRHGRAPVPTRLLLPVKRYWVGTKPIAARYPCSSTPSASGD